MYAIISDLKDNPEGGGLCATPKNCCLCLRSMAPSIPEDLVICDHCRKILAGDGPEKKAINDLMRRK